MCMIECRHLRKKKLYNTEQSPRQTCGSSLSLIFLPSQLEQRGYPLPTADFIRKKSKRIEQAKSFQFKEEDIEKVTAHLFTGYLIENEAIGMTEGGGGWAIEILLSAEVVPYTHITADCTRKEEV